MLVIRLSRTGRKKQPYYRVVVAEKSAPIKGRLVEVLGHFNPRTKDLEIDVERAKARVKDGAQPSETAGALLEKAGVLKRDKITEQNRRPERKSRKAIKAEAEGGDAPAATPAATDDAKTDDGDAAPADDAAAEEKPAKEEAAKSDDKPAATDDKADAKAEAKSDEKAAVADDSKNDAKDTNDAKGDSK